MVLKNGLFFTERVDIEVTLTPYDFPRKGTKLEVNRYLEQWSNQSLWGNLGSPQTCSCGSEPGGSL
jgi:hypothetical protein